MDDALGLEQHEPGAEEEHPPVGPHAPHRRESEQDGERKHCHGDHALADGRPWNLGAAQIQLRPVVARHSIVAGEIDLRRRDPLPIARRSGDAEGIDRLVLGWLRIDPETLALIEPGPDCLQAPGIGADQQERNVVELGVLRPDAVAVR